MGLSINRHQTLSEKIKLLWGLLPGKFYKLSPGPLREQNQVLNKAEMAGYSILEGPSGHELKKSEVQYSLRKGSSDYLVFNQVILEKEYQALIELAKNIFPQQKELIFVDAGANVGFATLAINHSLNIGKAICIEPDELNFKQLKKNLFANKLSNPLLLQTGLWNKQTRLKVVRDFRDGREWSLKVEETISNDPAGFDCVSLESLIKSNNLDQIDILKIDIEGGEKQVFEGLEQNPDLLKKIKIIAVEIHDEVADRNRINSFLLQSNFELSTQGETTLAVRKDLLR